MPEQPPRPHTPQHSVRLTDAKALRAYAHPVRMHLVGLLRVQGPFTATRAAELTGESVASCSYHLRMLAKYGLVEEAEGGQGREKPWRATARYTQWEEDDAGEATEALHAVHQLWSQQLARAVATRDGLSPEWRTAEQFGDDIVYLTPTELTALYAQFAELLAPYSDRFDDPSQRPEEAEAVTVLRVAYRFQRGEAAS